MIESENLSEEYFTHISTLNNSDEQAGRHKQKIDQWNSLALNERPKIQRMIFSSLALHFCSPAAKQSRHIQLPLILSVLVECALSRLPAIILDAHLLFLLLLWRRQQVVFVFIL